LERGADWARHARLAVQSVSSLRAACMEWGTRCFLSVCGGFCGRILLHTAVLSKIPHCNSFKSVLNRPLRGRRGRFGTILQQLQCGIFERTAVRDSECVLCCYRSILDSLTRWWQLVTSGCHVQQVVYLCTGDSFAVTVHASGSNGMLGGTCSSYWGCTQSWRV